LAENGTPPVVTNPNTMAIMGGSVGINTTAPSEKLEVNGNVKAAAYLYTSDKRLKKNVKTLDDALERILNLRGVSFKWIENEQAEIGFIAQEVEKEEPLLVVTSETTNMKSVKYGNIVALLVEAFKEEHKKIEENQKLLAIMQNGLEKVEKKVSKLEREVASLKDDNQKLQKQNEELKKEIDLIKKHLKLK
jgi:predicted ribosome quality control (RQC) complex YloA/Tae2 family protein